MTKYFVSDHVKLNQMGGVCHLRGKEECIQHLVETPEGEWPFARNRHRREYKMYLKKQWEGVGLINVAQDTDKWRDVVSTVMNLRVS